MKRAKCVAIVSLMLMVGCGEGPKHIPKSDYQHGKAAFELLEQFQTASEQPDANVESYGSFLFAAAEQRDLLSHSKNGLQEALGDYEEAIDEKISAEQDVKLSTLDVELATLKRADDAKVRSLQERKYATRQAVYEVEPIIKLCHDDVAQYFDANAASTNNCHSALTQFRSDHPRK